MVLELSSYRGLARLEKLKRRGYVDSLSSLKLRRRPDYPIGHGRCNPRAIWTYISERPVNKKRAGQRKPTVTLSAHRSDSVDWPPSRACSRCSPFSPGINSHTWVFSQPDSGLGRCSLCTG